MVIFQLSRAVNEDILNSITDGDDKIFFNLINELKEEIESKDLVLNNKILEIHALLEKMSKKDEEINLLKSKLLKMEHENDRSIEMVSHIF